MKRHRGISATLDCTTPALNDVEVTYYEDSAPAAPQAVLSFCKRLFHEAIKAEAVSLQLLLDEPDKACRIIVYLNDEGAASPNGWAEWTPTTITLGRQLLALLFQHSELGSVGQQGVINVILGPKSLAAAVVWHAEHELRVHFTELRPPMRVRYP